MARHSEFRDIPTIEENARLVLIRGLKAKGTSRSHVLDILRPFVNDRAKKSGLATRLVSLQDWGRIAGCSVVFIRSLLSGRSTQIKETSLAAQAGLLLAAQSLAQNNRTNWPLEYVDAVNRLNHFVRELETAAHPDLDLAELRSRVSSPKQPYYLNLQLDFMGMTKLKDAWAAKIDGLTPSKLLPNASLVPAAFAKSLRTPGTPIFIQQPLREALIHVAIPTLLSYESEVEKAAADLHAQLLRISTAELRALAFGWYGQASMRLRTMGDDDDYLCGFTIRRGNIWGISLNPMDSPYFSSIQYVRDRKSHWQKLKPGEVPGGSKYSDY